MFINHNAGSYSDNEVITTKNRYALTNLTKSECQYFNLDVHNYGIAGGPNFCRFAVD